MKAPALATALLLALAAAALRPAPAAAHGGVALDDDPCRGEAGGRVLHFSAYQPAFNPTEEYCADLPQVGPAILVVDLVDRSLRQVPLSLRVEEASGGVLFQTPANVYADGVLNAEVAFATAGAYVVVVAFAAGGSVRFPLLVATGFSPLLLWIPVVLAAAPVLYWLARRRVPAPQRTPIAGLPSTGPRTGSTP